MNMLLDPDGISKIIVGILLNGKYRWYISEKDLWFMNLEKLRADTRKKIAENPKIKYNMDNYKPSNERTGIDILNEFSIQAFLLKIEKYRKTVDELRELLELYLAIDEKEDVYFRFLPALHLDFDKKELYSLYTEYESFEAYVAEGWMGKRESFLGKIDVQERYWCQKNGNTIMNFEKGFNVIYE